MRPVALTCAALSLPVLGVVACGQEEETPPSPVVDAGTVCMGPQDCPTGHECREGRCVSVADGDVGPPADATADSSETGPDVPDTGHAACEPPCPGNQLCDPETAQCLEADPCASDDDCLGRRRCLDGACELPPERCYDDRDCSGEWVCGAGGHCEPPAGCQREEQCEPLYCDEYSGRCEACVGDAHCPGNQRCQPDAEQGRNLCAEPAVCLEDLDCLGVRVCVEGACQAGDECADDAWAGNTSSGEAVEVAAGRYPDLVRCDRLDDWFVVPLLAGEGLVASIAFDTALDLSLALFAPDDTLVPMLLSDGAHGVEQVLLGAAPTDGAYRLRVSGRVGQQGPYVLELQAEEAFCAPDRLEGGGGNDEPERAVAVPLGNQELLGLSLCPGDQDWFFVQPARPSALHVAVEAPIEALDLEVSRADAPHVALAEARAVAPGRWELEAELEAGTHLLRVAAPVGPLGAAYDLSTSLGTSTAYLQQRCEQAPLLEFGQPLAGATLDEAPDFLPTCAAPGHDAPEALFRVHLDAPDSLRARLLRADFDAVLSLRAACLEPDSEQGCGRRPAPLYLPEVPAGDYVLLVDGYDQGAGSFELLLERGVPGPLPGDGCQEPLSVALSPGEAMELLGDTAPAEGLFAPLGCGDLVDTSAGRDLVYRVELPQATWLSALAEGEDWEPLLALYGPSCGQDELHCASDGQIVALALDPGTYHLVVDGRSRLGSGPFSLLLMAEPPLLPPGNDSCDTAEPLQAAELPAAWDVAGNTAAASPDHPSACGLGEPADAGAEVVYGLHLPEPAVLSVLAQADFPYVLRLEGAPCGGGPLLACQAGGALESGVLPAGDHFLFVDGWGPDDRGPFELSLRLDPPPLACDRQGELVPGQVFEGDTERESAGQQGSCGGVGPERAHRLVLAEPAQVRVVAATDFGQPVLYLRQVCGEPASELACVAGGGPLVVPALAAGEYALFVDTDQAEGGRYLLDLALGPPGAAPLNDRCATATDVGPLPEQPALSVEGATLHAGGEHGTECGDVGDPVPGPDVFYRFSLAERSLVRAELQADFDAALAVLAGPCDAVREQSCARAAPDAPARLETAVLDPGDYLLLVTGLDAEQAGVFHLELQAVPEGGLVHPCDVATPLPVASATAGDNTGAIDTVQPGCAAQPGWPQPESVFTFRLDEPRSVRLRILDTAQQGALALRAECRLLDQELACTQETDLRLPALPAGSYAVLVDGYVRRSREPAPYSVVLQTGPPEGELPGDDCASAEPLDLAIPASVQLEGDLAGLGDHLQPACGPEGGPERIWQLDLDRAAILDLRLEAGFEGVVALRGADCAAGPELDCGPGLSGLRLEPGRYHIVLEGPPGAQGGYQLGVEVREGPANDDCLAPAELQFLGDRAEVAGSLALATPRQAAIGCGLAEPTLVGADRVYSFRLDVPAWVVANAQGASPPALWLRSEACLDGPEQACGLGELATDALLPAGLYFLFVDAGVAEPGPFALQVVRTPSPPPANDDCATPELLELPAEGGALQVPGSLASARGQYVPADGVCPPGAGHGPDVVYALDLVAPMSLRAGVRSDADVAVYLSEPCGVGETLACGGTDGALVTGPLSPGRHHIIVDAPGAVEDVAGFWLDVELLPPPENDDCDGPLPLVLGADGSGSVEGDTRLAASSASSAGCGGEGAPDLFYRFELDVPSDLLVQVEADFEVIVHLRGDPCTESSLSCASPPLELRALPAGVYHLVVDGTTSGEAGQFRLLVQATPAQARPLDDKCTAARTVVPVAGEALVVGHGGGADALLGSPGCPAETPASPERVFRLELQQPATLSVTTEHADRPLVVSLLAPDRLPPRAPCSQHQELTCGTGDQPIVDLALEPEEYFLVVDGAEPEGPGAFRLRLQVGETPNEKCQAARWLLPAPGGVLFAGTTAGASSVLAPAGCGEAAAAAEAPEALVRFTFDERVALSVETVATDLPLAVSLRALPCGAAEELGCGLSAAGPVLLDDLVLEPAEYALIVDGAEPGEVGDFELLLVARPHRLATEKCAEAPFVVLGPDAPRTELLGDASQEDARLAPQGCAPGAPLDAPEALVRVELTEEGLLSAEVLASEGDAVVYLLGTEGGDDCDLAPELACGIGAQPLRQVWLGSGEYLLAVDGLTGDGPGEHSLALTWEPTPAAKCAAAEELVLDAGELLVVGDSAGASGVLQPSGCGGDIDGVAPEVVYELRLPEPRLVTVSVELSEHPAVVYLRAPCTGAQDLFCATAEEPSGARYLSAGRYGLVVDGHAGQGPGAFELRLLAEAQGDTCAAPLELWGGAGTQHVPGSTGGANDFLQTAGCPTATDGPDLFYLLDLPVTSDVDLAISGVDGFPDPSVYVLGDCAAPDAPLACGTLAEAVRLRAAAPGSYIVVVDSELAPTRYELDLRISDLPAACDGADSLVDGVPLDGETTEEADSVTGTCVMPGASPDSVYRLVLQQAASVTLAVEGIDFEPVLVVLDGCSLDASELGCRTGSGSLSWHRLAAGQYLVAVDGQQGGRGSFRLTLATGDPEQPGGGQGCDGAELLDPVGAGGVLEVFGSTAEGHGDSFGFCDTPAAPDAAFALELERPLDLRLGLRAYAQVASLTLVPEECHDGRADPPWDPPLGEPLLCQSVPAGSFAHVRELERVPAGRYTLVVDGDVADAAFDFDLEVQALEQSTLYAPVLVPGQLHQGTLVGQPDRFPEDCGVGEAPAGPDAVHRVLMPSGVATLRADVSGAPFAPSLAVYAHPLRGAAPVACAAAAELAHAGVWEARYVYLVVGALDGLAGEYTLQVAVERPE